MRLSLFIAIVIILFSCDRPSETEIESKEKKEVWKTTYIKIQSKDDLYENDFDSDTSTYLILMDNGQSFLIDSVSNTEISRFENSWRIEEIKDDSTLFILEPKEQSEGILTVVYPILQKNDSLFKMELKADEGNRYEHHVWNLVRIQ